MNPSLEGYAAAIFEGAGPEESASLSDELNSFKHLVGTSAPLRVTLADTSVAAAARRAIVWELLEGKVSERARRLAAYAVSAVRAPEVLSALGWLSHRAGAAGGIELSLLGHIGARQRVGGYATAVFEEAGLAELEEVEDQLFRFARIVESFPDLLAKMTDREVPAAARRAVVDDLLADKVEPATLRLAKFVVAGGRARDFVGLLDWLVERSADARGWRVARVRAAEPLDDAQRNSLASALSRLSGAPVDLQVTLDRALIGGVVVGIGNLRVDASARGRLEALREELLPTGPDRGAGGHDRTRGRQ